MTYITNPGNYLTVPEAADRKNVAVSTVRAWLSKGQLPGIKFEGLGWIVEEKVLMAFTLPSRGQPRKGTK